MEEHVVIIGNGISGVTAARHIRKLSDKRITIISGESEHFFSRTALMYVYMGHMKYEHIKPYEDYFWKKNRIGLKSGIVKSIDTNSKTLELESAEVLSYDKLIIATGSRTKTFGWPGQNAKGVIGFYSKQDLEALESFAPNNVVCKRAVIIGGGLIGIELAEMLNSRQIPVTFLVRESSFWNTVLPEGESQMLSRHILSHGIDLRLNSNLKAIQTDAEGKVQSIIIDETGEQIDCNLVVLATGVAPNIEFIKSSNIATNQGVLVNSYLETNIKDVYAIGDCAEQHQAIGQRKPIEAVWYTGRMMGEIVAQSICSNRLAYQPGHWFNSAKFFDIEYQTYGWVFAQPKNQNIHFHWKHKNDTICITMEFHPVSREFVGINNFGIRMRHEVFDRWLTEKQSIDYVIKNLEKANFDPEFYKHFEKDISSSFQQLQLLSHES